MLHIVVTGFFFLVFFFVCFVLHVNICKKNDDERLSY